MSTITADTTPVFPRVPTFGFTVEPQYLVSVIAREGGYERRVRRWSRPLNRYTAVPMGTRPNADIYAVLNFWHAMGGMASVFRFEDYADYKSCAPDNTPTALDQPITSLGGGSYQLIKRYAVGSITQDREIRRPVGSTILIANGSGSTQTDWTLNEATGVLTVGGSFSGTPTTWGGRFHVPVRFASELPIELTHKVAQRTQFELFEVRE